MDKNTAANALNFLQRAQLTGNEVAAFVEVTQALHAIATGLVAVSKPVPQELAEEHPALHNQRSPRKTRSDATSEPAAVAS
ncbi:MAG TPA: hypothetical protein VL614_14905 [Acetobacteraceae bacterium]|jgi:hypothetical protein|nr:hypothetical protein [Acetobacteraceae bacterium]